MDIRHIDPGARYSRVVVHAGTAYVAGQVAQRTKGLSVREQTEEVLGLLDAALASAGTSKSRLLMVNVYLADVSSFAEMNEAYDAWVDRAAMPTRVTVEARIADPRELVEVSAVAAV